LVPIFLHNKSLSSCSGSALNSATYELEEKIHFVTFYACIYPSSTRTGLDCAKNPATNISCLGNFKLTIETSLYAFIYLKYIRFLATEKVYQK
jgi:hypothetical protein